MWRGIGLILLCLVTFTAGLGQSAITDSDEAYYAEAGREMLVSGNWTTPHYNSEPRLQKPVLFYWLIAATYRIVGVNEWAARVWSALAGVGLALVAAAVARRWGSVHEGLLAGAIVGTSFGVVPIARQSLPDVPLAFFVSVTIWAAIEAMAPVASARRSSSWRPHHWLYLCAGAAALGMLTKGPVAIALPVTVLIPLLWLAWRRAEPPLWSRLRMSHLAVASILFVALAAPWYVAVMRAQGLDYARQFFIGENVERFATSTYNSWRGWLYIPVIVAGLLPWSPFAILWWRPLRDWWAGRRTMTAIDARLVCWACGPLVFFMISVGSQPRYILPCLVPLAVMLARSMWRVASSGAEGPPDRRYRVAAIGSGLAITLVGALLWRAAGLLVVPGHAIATSGPGVMLAIGVVTTVVVLVVSMRAVPLVIAVAAVSSLTVFEWSLLSPGRPEPVETIATAIRAAGADLPVCACGALGRSLNFYTHSTVQIANVTADNVEEARQFLDTDRRVLAVMDGRALDRLEASLARRFPRLAEVDYLNTFVWRRGDTLPDPDPALVQHVVLISNR